MADSTFWHKLVEQFARLAPAKGLSLEWQYTSGNPGKHRYWLDSSDLTDHESFRLKFERLARTAGAALNESGDQDSLEVWYKELREHDRDPRNQGEFLGPEELGDGTKTWHQRGRVPNVCEASARCCDELEIQEFEAERQRRQPNGRELLKGSTFTAGQSDQGRPIKIKRDCNRPMRQPKLRRARSNGSQANTRVEHPKTANIRRRSGIQSTSISVSYLSRV